MRLSLIALLLAGCSGGDMSLTSAASAAPPRCGAGYVRKGNRCVKIPTPPPPPAPTPEPVPTPPPPPPVDSGPGLPDIPSNFDINLGLVADPAIIASSGAQLTGNFRFICHAGQILADDPIVFPGQPGRSHLHQFYGNTNANGNSDFVSLRLTGKSTCGGPDYAVNRSAYWMPALLDGKGSVIRPDYVAVYYKRRPASDPVVSDPTVWNYQGKAAALVPGLRFTYGWDPTGLNLPRTGAAYFNCDGAGSVQGHYATIPEAMQHCVAGGMFGAIISAPDCWDGKNLDAIDHRSHVGYSSYGDWGHLKCDAAHPYVIPTFTLGAWYKIEPGDDTSKWRFSSDDMVPGAPAGFTFHADWFGAWDNTVMSMWMDNCIDKQLNCQGGQLGNGFSIKNGSFGPYFYRASDGQFVVSATPVERLVPVLGN